MSHSMNHQAPSLKPQAGSRSRIERSSNDLGYTIAAVVIAVLALAATLLAPRWLPPEWFAGEGIGASSHEGIEPEENMPTPLNGPSRQGATEQQVAVMVGLYQRAADDINAALAESVRRLEDEPENRGAAFRLARASELRQRVSAAAARADARAKDLFAPIAREVYELGVRQADQQARDLGVSGAAAAGVGFTNVDEDAVAVIARDIVARQTRALGDHADRAVVVFKSVQAADIAGRFVEGERVSSAIARGLISGDPRIGERALRAVLVGRDGERLDTAEYRRAGKQIIEVGGWSGSLAAYASTVNRTRTREATVTARHDRLTRRSVTDLVQITGRVSVNFCTRFIGLVVALTPEAASRTGHPTLASLPGGGPPFHPNCSKGTVAYIEGIVSDERETLSRNAAARYARAVENGTLLEDVAA